MKRPRLSEGAIQIGAPRPAALCPIFAEDFSILVRHRRLRRTRVDAISARPQVLS